MKRIVHLFLLSLLFLLFFPAPSSEQTAYTRMLSGVNVVTSGIYTFVPLDSSRLTSFSGSLGSVGTLPAPTTPGFGVGAVFSVQNLGPGIVTIVTAGGLIYSTTTIQSSAASLVLFPGAGADIYSNGVNYYAQLGVGSGGGGVGPNTYPPSAVQTFLSDGTGSALVLSFSSSPPGVTAPSGSFFINPGPNGDPHVGFTNADTSLSLANLNDSPCVMRPGCTGDPTAPIVTAVGPAISNAFFINPTMVTPTFLNNTQDLWRFYNGSVSTTCTQSPAAGQLAACKNSSTDALLLSYGTTLFRPVGRTMDQGTVSMTTAAIASLACGATVQVTSTAGILTSDVISASNAATVAANNGVLTVKNWVSASNTMQFEYCNPTAGSITPTAATLNWQVVR